MLANEGEALRIGDVLGQYADHKLRAAAWSESDRDLVKRMLPVLVSAEGTPLIVPIEDIVARAPSAVARARELLRDLTDFRLLTSLRDERGREALTPVHTTLIGGWSLMRDALEGTAELEAFLRRFDRDARDWHASQRDPAKLWPAAAARDFDRWQAALSDIDLSLTQRDFRGAVVAHSKRAKLLRMGLVAGLATLAIGGTWAGITFANQATEAEALRQDALTQKASAERQTKLSEAHRREADELIDFMLGDLRQRLEPLGQVRVLRSVAEQASGYLDRREGQLDGAADAARRATVLRNLSAVFFEEGDSTQAAKTARESLAISQQLAKEAPTPVAQRAVALSHTTLGVVQFAQGDLAGALESYKAALLIYDALAAAALDDNNAQRDVSVINDRIGDVLSGLGQVDAALLAYRASLQISERLYAADPTHTTFRRDVIVATNKVALSLQAQGVLDGARALREQALTLVEAAAKDTNTAQAQRDLAVSRTALGDVLLLSQERALALESFQVALEINKRLAAADPMSANAQRDVAVLHNKVGDAKLYAGDAAGALSDYRVSIEITARLAKSDPANVRFQLDHAHTLSRLGNAQIALGDADAGLAAKVEMLAIFEAVARDSNTDPARVEHIQAIANYADGLRNAGRLDEARRQAERARTLLAPLLAKPDALPWWKGVDEWIASFLTQP